MYYGPYGNKTKITNALLRGEKPAFACWVSVSKAHAPLCLFLGIVRARLLMDGVACLLVVWKCGGVFILNGGVCESAKEGEGCGKMYYLNSGLRAPLKTS